MSICMCASSSGAGPKLLVSEGQVLTTSGILKGKVQARRTFRTLTLLTSICSGLNVFRKLQVSLLWYGVVNRILPSNAHFFTCCGIVLTHSMDSRSVRISFERVCFRLHPASHFVTFKHSHQGHTKKSKISGRPNRRFFSSLGYCVRISRHWRALFQNGLISLFWYGVVNRILPSKAHFAGASALHGNTAWTQHDMCSALGPSEYPLSAYVSGCIQN